MAATAVQAVRASAGIVIAPARKPQGGSDPLTRREPQGGSDPLTPEEEWDRLERARVAARADVEDVGGRVLRHLTGAPAPGAIEAPGVLVVRDLTPGDAAALDRALVQGIAVGRGGATSHAAILARALGIPAVVGLGDRLGELADGTLLVLDGGAGPVEVDPPAGTLGER